MLLLFSHIQLLSTPWTVACQASLSFTISRSLLKLMSIESVMPSRGRCPILPLPSIFLSTRVFCNESALRIRWPKNRSLSFSISPSNEYSGLISFRMDWLYLLTVQGTLKIGNPEVNLFTYGQLIFDKGVKTIQWRNDGLFSKWCW